MKSSVPPSHQAAGRCAQRVASLDRWAGLLAGLPRWLTLGPVACSLFLLPLLCASWSLQQPAVQADDRPPAADEKTVDKKAADKDKAEDQKFVRTLLDDAGKPVMLQTAVVTYKADSGPYTGAQVDLIGAIHIADKAYFEKLNQRFTSYDALLYEMVADPEVVKRAKADAKDRSAVSAVQSGMKDMLGLSFQLDIIDYQAKNFVHADMNPGEFTQSLSERQEGLMQFVMRSMGSSLALQGSRKTSDLDVLGALFSGNRELALKRVLSGQIEDMEGQLAAISGDDGKSTLITERNTKALEVLKRELDAGKKRLGIFYGAGHFPHMSEELGKQFKLRPVKTEWLDAWDMHDAPKKSGGR